jgi:hypothetical protein
LVPNSGAQRVLFPIIDIHVCVENVLNHEDIFSVAVMINDGKWQMAKVKVKNRKIVSTAKLMEN